MLRFRVLLEYDGTDFCGWQRQATGRSVQGAVEEALAGILGAPELRVHGAGRTDAGVHARGQVAHLDARTRLDPAALGRALNARLPEDVAARRVEIAEPGFDARRDAISKTYVYRILLGPEPSPLRRRTTWHLRGPLDVDRMMRAADPLQGTHDFAAYRGAPGGADPEENTVRRVDRLDIEALGDEVRVTVEGPGFLRHMVRNLVGTLVEVGQGRRPGDDPARILAGRERSGAGPTAPARGLCLERVVYPDRGPADAAR